MKPYSDDSPTSEKALFRLFGLVNRERFEEYVEPAHIEHLFTGFLLMFLYDILVILH